MLEKLRKKSIIKSLPLAIILLICGIGMVGIEFSAMKALIRGNVQFESLAPEEIGNDLVVDVTLRDNFGCYMEEYEENTKTHRRRTTDLYYVIWTGDEDDEDFRYMGIKVPASDESAMERMAEATYNYEISDPINYTGAIIKMSSEEHKYFKEYFLESGFTEEEFEANTLPYFINVGALTGGAAGTAVGIAVIGGVLILIAVIMVIVAVSGGGLKKLKKELTAAGLGEANLDLEYEGATLVNKTNDFRIGKKLSFYVQGSRAHILVNSKIIWAYQRTTTHRTNGIKTGTSYEIVFYDINKKRTSIAVSSESNVQDALQHINNMMPWVVVGYQDEIFRLYQKEFQEFLKLRYNQYDPSQMI